MSEYAGQVAQGFGRSRECFEQLVAGLADAQAGELTHAQLEDRLAEQGRALLRLLLQDHLQLRAVREQRRLQVVGADEVARKRMETGHERGLATVFWPVTVTRMAYRAPGVDNLYPADAVLSLPAGRHSHGLRRLAAVESVRGSFQDAVTAVERTWLREATAKAVARADRKLRTRLSPGEKRGRKRMAELAVVYDAVPVPRTPAGVITGGDQRRRRRGPRRAR